MKLLIKQHHDIIKNLNLRITFTATSTPRIFMFLILNYRIFLKDSGIDFSWVPIIALSEFMY